MTVQSYEYIFLLNEISETDQRRKKRRRKKKKKKEQVAFPDSKQKQADQIKN